MGRHLRLRTFQLSSLLLVAALLCQAQAAAEAREASQQGVWITHPTAPAHGPVVLEFRRDFDIASVPAHAAIRVSADNRYILFVNGSRVGAGPSLGDPAHWRYAAYDIARFLRSGHNHVGAIVWNHGDLAPTAQMSVQTGFLVQVEDDTLSFLNSGTDWRVQIDTGYSAASPLPGMRAHNWWYAAAPSETIDGAKRNWSWDDDYEVGQAWSNAVAVTPAAAKGTWTLVADRLPAMRFDPVNTDRIVRSDVPDGSGFPAGPLTLPAHWKGHILLDHGAVFAAYPKLTVSGGTGARVRVTFTEALYDQAYNKGDRSAVDDRQAVGLEDVFLPDGKDSRVFEPLSWRVWRFLDICVETADEPLTLGNFQAAETGYPFALRAHFESSDPELDAIWRTGWRTLQIDAHDTYMDSAYWERLQYIGDARIEALITYATTADPRLPLQALDAIRFSKTTDGITESRYPTRDSQSIPTFSLLWIGMLHDYRQYVDDRTTVRAGLPLVRSILAWFARYQLPNGLLGKVPGWTFVDWITHGDRSYPSFAPDGSSCVVTLLYLGALDQSADMELASGDKQRAKADRRRAKSVRHAIRAACWDAGRGIVADTAEKRTFSQDANALAVLYDVVPKAQQKRVMQVAAPPGVAAPEGVLPASYYFRFYLARAYVHAGLADEYLQLLQPWRDLLRMHFTSWPESGEPARSDTHAWSGHPTYDLLDIVAGIQPAAPGFAGVRIEPHLGTLTSLAVGVPTPKGQIEVRYKLSDHVLKAEITLPKGLPGKFVWRRTILLHEGKNHLRLREFRPGG